MLPTEEESLQLELSLEVLATYFQWSTDIGDMTELDMSPELLASCDCSFNVDVDPGDVSGLKNISAISSPTRTWSRQIPRTTVRAQMME